MQAMMVRYMATCLFPALLVGLSATGANPERESSLPAAHSRPGDCPSGLAGAWRGELPASVLFLVHLTVAGSTESGFHAEIDSEAGREKVRAWTEGPYLRFQSETAFLSFRGRISADSSRIDGFIQQGSSLVRMVLTAPETPENRRWTATWSPLMVEDPALAFDLYIEDDGAGGLGGYFFFRDQRLPPLWGYGLGCEGGIVSLGEKSLGLSFRGIYDEPRDQLVLDVAGPAGAASMRFARMASEEIPPVPDAPATPPREGTGSRWTARAPESLDDGWRTASPESGGLDVEVIGELVDAVVKGKLEYTHSLLIARNGRLLVEEYFYGFDRETRHDMRSASKSVTSTLVGIAIDEGRIQSSDTGVLSCFPDYRRYRHWDDRKAEIRIRHLLTMSSGLDARDGEPESAASERAYQSQSAEPDWTKFALDAPMLWDPGEHLYYGGANPLILGGILARAVGEPVEWFADRTLFAPLGIRDYSFFLDPLGIPYMGGGMFMRPRDMLKYGQLYLDGGTWAGHRIVSEEWIRESRGRYGRLGPIDRNGHQYGYLWWHHAYDVDDVTIETLEARGNGGQYIFVVPSLDMVAVITSGNYRNGGLRQPEEILRRWVLPAVK
ncbi:MAG: serine hydrolase [Gemmatimonadota bacterium]